MADELDDGLLIDEHLVAYSDDENEHTKPKATTSTSHTDKAAEKKRKRREQAKAQRRKVRNKDSTYPRNQPRFKNRSRQHGRWLCSQLTCKRII